MFNYVQFSALFHLLIQKFFWGAHFFFTRYYGNWMVDQGLDFKHTTPQQRGIQWLVFGPLHTPVCRSDLLQ